MDEADDKSKPNNVRPREISNACLFAADITFSDTEKILFEEDLNDHSDSGCADLMDGNPAKRYSVVKKLNEGGMKAIWEVDDHRTARKVAMALIQESKIASEKEIDAFLYEARLTSNLQHPNIIPIYDIALDESGNPYFTMKALKGETLGEILHQLRNKNAAYENKYSRTHLLSIFLKVCNAISYAHSKGVIHLDLKPSNIIVGDYGEVHVLDWGLATLITHLDEHDGESISWHSADDVALENGQTLTRYLERASENRRQRNLVGGTPGYMAPEQTQGAPIDIDFQTDVYTLGALLYEILTYCIPISGDTIKQVLQKTVRGEIEPLKQRAPALKIPASLAAIAMQALRTTPADRYPTVAALICDLRKFQDGFATRAEHPTFITHVALLVNRHKVAVSLIVASITLLTGVLIQGFVKVKHSERVAIQAWATLHEKNEYIATTAKQVAPDYLELAAQQEKNYAFRAAEQSLDTCLAFDPTLKEAQFKKGQILLSQQRFSEAWEILSGQPSAPLQLAEKYKTRTRLFDSELPQLVRDFTKYGMAESIPRLFYHLNRSDFDPTTRFVALAQALQILNPKNEDLYFSYQEAPGGGWQIDVSQNPYLDTLSPLCGLQIQRLNASHTGTPNLKILTEPKLTELHLAGTTRSHLVEIDQLTDLKVLNISHTQIRNLAHLIKYPNLTTLDISGIDGLAISPHLVWLQNLRTLIVAEHFKNNPTLQALANRGVIIIYTDL